MIQSLLVAARFVHFAAAAVLFGGWLYGLHGLRGATLAALRARVVARLRPVLLAAAVAAVASGALWIAMTVANIGGGLASVADLETWSIVLAETGFGRVWVARLALGAVLVGVAAAGARTRAAGLDRAAGWLAAALLASLALLGHTQDEEGGARLAHMAADAVHLLGAGAWLGGLVALAVLLRLQAGGSGASAPLAETHQALGRFSAMGYLAVAGIVASGLVNSWFLVGAPAALFGTAYGRLLLVKLALFGLMFALAAENRLRVTPRLLAAARAEAPPPDALRAIRRNVAREQVLGAGVLAAVAVLGAIAPASAMH